jgi:hypothetical protein
MAYHDNNPNRPTNDQYVRRTMTDGGMGYGIPLGLLAVAIVLGALFMWPTDMRTTTASNSTPAATTETAPGGPARTTPAPTPTAPTKIQ